MCRATFTINTETYYMYLYTTTTTSTMYNYVEMSNSLGPFLFQTYVFDHKKFIHSGLPYSSIEVTYDVGNSQRFFNSGQGFPLNRHPSSTSFTITKRTNSPRYIPENDFSNLQTNKQLTKHHKNLLDKKTNMSTSA